MTSNIEDIDVIDYSVRTKETKKFFTDPLPFWDYLFKGIPLIFLRISCHI